MNCFRTIFQVTLFQAHQGIYYIITAVTDIPLFTNAGVVDDGR
jgi:hypothetical protein